MGLRWSHGELTGSNFFERIWRIGTVTGIFATATELSACWQLALITTGVSMQLDLHWIVCDSLSKRPGYLNMQ